MFLCLFFWAALAFGIYSQRYFGTVPDQIKEKLISEQKELISAVKSLDDMIRQCHSWMSTLTFVCTFPSTDDPLEVFFCFFYVLIAKKSAGVLGLAACRTLANLRSPRHCSNLRFPAKQDDGFIFLSMPDNKIHPLGHFSFSCNIK